MENNKEGFKPHWGILAFSIDLGDVHCLSQDSPEKKVEPI